MSKTAQERKNVEGEMFSSIYVPGFSDMTALTLYWTTHLESSSSLLSFVFHKLGTVPRLSRIIFSSLNFRF